MTRHVLFLVLVFSILLTIPVGLFADTPANQVNPPGYYRIHCNVNGAYVYLDDTIRGVISNGILVVPLSPGANPFSSIKVWKEGYTTYIAPINPIQGPGEYLDVTVTIQQIPQTGPGIINLLSNPPGAAVLLDGVPKGTVPDSGVLILERVPAGDHQVELRLEGFDSQQKGVFVPGDGIARISFTLQPATAGGLCITSEPIGALVLIDNQYTGVTPLNVTGVSLGSHTLTLRMNGYQDLPLTTSVTAGAVNVLSGTLTLIPPPTTPPTTKSGMTIIIPLCAGVFTVLCIGRRRC